MCFSTIKYLKDDIQVATFSFSFTKKPRTKSGFLVLSKVHLARTTTNLKNALKKQTKLSTF